MKRLRGAPRRLRALARWAAAFEGWFPPAERLAPERRYWNLKIPVDLNLVESRQTTDGIRRACAQSLIDACAHLVQARPDWAAGSRVTCVVCLPDMFTSELCIYLSDDYFRSHTDPASGAHGETRAIQGRRLSQEWGLLVPDGLGELGMSVAFFNQDDDRHLAGERWYFGEVTADPEDR